MLLPAFVSSRVRTNDSVIAPDLHRVACQGDLHLASPERVADAVVGTREAHRAVAVDLADDHPVRGRTLRRRGERLLQHPLLLLREVPPGVRRHEHRVVEDLHETVVTDEFDGLSGEAPALVACFGVGTDTAGALLVSAGDNPQRLRSEAAFAHHCGVAPIDASSGLTIRKRLNRGGDRTANQALWRIVMVRMVHDPRTRRYVERRTREGRSKREIIRSLKRYVARQLYRHLPRAKSLA